MNDSPFDLWLADVDGILLERAGLESNDVPVAYRRMHREGYTPEQAADVALQHAAITME